jgi:arylsulfatase A-like enzyme
MNVILIILDSLRADHVGCYGNTWIRTPTLDGLAQESIVFTRAFPESLPTIPMRRAIHTGKRTFPFRDWVPQKGDWVLCYGWQRIPEDQITLPETLEREGYHTAFITDAYHQFKPSMNFHRGFRQWRWVRGQELDLYGSRALVKKEAAQAVMPHGLSGTGEEFLRALVSQHLANQRLRHSEEDCQAPRVFREAMQWLEENRGVEPFFLLVDSFDPHEPWDPPRHYVDLYDPGYGGREIISPRYGPSDYLSEAELKHMRALYAGELTMVDRWLGLFLDRARDLGMLEDTLLIVTSDHGHQLGEHGLTGKVSWGLWYELMDVPLFLRLPDGARAGTRVDAFAQHHDIAPTVLGALGIQPASPMDGVDLLDLAAGRLEPRQYVVSGFNNYVWYRDDRYVYVGRNDGTHPQLFDMEADPFQHHDLSAEQPGLVEELRRRVLAEAGGPLPVYADVLQEIDMSWYRV